MIRFQSRGSFLLAILGFVVGLSATSPATAAPVETVTSITTSVFSTGQVTVRSGITGPNGTYSLTYDGVELRLNTFTLTSGKVGSPVANGYAIVRRNTAPETGDAAAGTSSNPPQVNAWNAVVSGGGTTTQTVRGRYFDNLSDLYTSQNLWTGTENLLVNANSNPGNARSNVERVDYIFSGLTATTDTGFLAFDRGRNTSGSNGPFKAAAITGFDINGNPIFDGSAVVSVAQNSYGDGTLIANVRYSVLEKKYLNPGYSTGLDQMRNDNIGPQGISGAYIAFTDLVAAGTTVYGYAVFGTDVTATGSLLNDWTNPTYFPTNSPIENDLDYVASGAVLFAVPEPSTIAMTFVGTLVLLIRYVKKRFGRTASTHTNLSTVAS